MLYGRRNVHRDFIFLSVTRRKMCVGPMYASKIRILELFQTIIFLLMNELLFKKGENVILVQECTRDFDR